ncbi:MAG: ABC transporter ATP-binding protein [Actinomycetota bacterium]
MGPTAISTRDLTYEFAPGVGAAGVDLDVPAGTVYGFLGPNGAGKSTTIRMLVGLVRPQRGTVEVLGLDPWRDGPAMRARIGVLGSDQAAPRHHDGESLLRLSARLRERPGVVDRGRALAERLRLDLSKPGHELSLGNRQKLGLVAALAHEPELVILDEPTNGLDPLLQRDIESLFRELADEGRTILLSSHSLPEVERVADHIGFIREARLVEQAPLARLAERAVRRVVLRFDRVVEPAAFGGVEGVDAVDRDDAGTELSVAFHGTVAPLLRRAGDLGAVSIEARGVDLEETFFALYRPGSA